MRKLTTTSAAAAAVLSAVLWSVVAGDGVVFGISGGGQAFRGEAVADNQQTNQFRGTGRRELPV